MLILLMTVAGLYFTNYQIRSNHMDSKYMYLTGTWNTIMNESIKYPEFNQKELTVNYRTAFTPKQVAQYNTYVRWLGGLIEDLYFNRYQERGWEFFDPWVGDTFLTHKKWFLDHQNLYVNSPEMINRIGDLAKPIR